MRPRNRGTPVIIPAYPPDTETPSSEHEIACRNPKKIVFVENFKKRAAQAEKPISEAEALAIANEIWHNELFSRGDPLKVDKGLNDAVDRWLNGSE